jgi:hypothetical protein
MEIMIHIKAQYLTCDCGNIPEADGFFPCDVYGNEIEPTLDSEWAGLYVCGACKKIHYLSN